MEVATLTTGQGADVTRRFAVQDSSQIAATRREALALAGQIGLGERECADLAVLVSEAASNLVKHAREGTCLLRSLVHRPAGKPDQRGIEILCLDHGPGMRDVAACLRDGFSTAGSLGSGLGALRRMSSAFDLYSLPGGTALLLELWNDGPPARAPQRLALGAVSVAHRDEQLSGDAWACVTNGAHATLLVVDGLGHGPLAARASNDAIACFLAEPGRDPEQIVLALDAGLRSSRGAAAAVTRIDHARGRVDYCGVGNVAGTLFHRDRVQRMVSHPGTLGHGVKRTRSFEYDWTPETTLVLHTDGISQRWDLARYPGILGRSHALLAGVLFRDFGRDTDDATVIVAGAPA
jgi:anti-sigma regulatory factor (Ser/Thr protein kinase)